MGRFLLPEIVIEATFYPIFYISWFFYLQCTCTLTEKDYDLFNHSENISSLYIFIIIGKCYIAKITDFLQWGLKYVLRGVLCWYDTPVSVGEVNHLPSDQISTILKLPSWKPQLWVGCQCWRTFISVCILYEHIDHRYCDIRLSSL